MNRSPSWAFVLAPVFSIIAVVVAKVEGTLGSSSDVQLWDDIRRVIRPSAVAASKPSFPLIRDFPSVVLMIAMVGTCFIVWRQWKLFHAALPAVVNAGVLSSLGPGSVPSYQARHKLLLMDRLVKPTASETALEALFRRVNGWFNVVGKFSEVIGAVAVILAVMLVIGENHGGIFRVLLPEGEAPAPWLASTYSSWWASINHVGGVVTYGFISWFGMYVILLQNAVGLICVYFLIGLEATADMNYDFLAGDQCGGWAALTKAYKSVHFSLVLHGLTLSVLVVILGVGIPWLVLLMALWVCVIPLYLWIPHRMFGRVAAAARKRHLAEIRKPLEVTQATTASLQDAYHLSVLRGEVERIAVARLNPLRVRRSELPQVLIAVLLPILLTIAQIIVPLRFGQQGSPAAPSATTTTTTP